MTQGVHVDAEIELLDRASIDVWASTENLRMVRLLISAFGTNHGASVDDLEDLRIATDDMCAHLMAHAPTGGRLIVHAATMRLGEQSPVLIGVHAQVDRAENVRELDEIVALIMGAATDRFGVVHGCSAAQPTWKVERVDGADGVGLALDEPAESNAGQASVLTGWFCRSLHGSDPGSDPAQ
ncbi:MAG: hypothetical protein KDB26_01875 [Microthrixaceae bacterium]|nr:hypothetical protein [Microthrixaceae bacterium]